MSDKKTTVAPTRRRSDTNDNKHSNSTIDTIHNHCSTAEPSNNYIQCNIGVIHNHYHYHSSHDVAKTAKNVTDTTDAIGQGTHKKIRCGYEEPLVNVREAFGTQAGGHATGTDKLTTDDSIAPINAIDPTKTIVTEMSEKEVYYIHSFKDFALLPRISAEEVKNNPKKYTFILTSQALKEAKEFAARMDEKEKQENGKELQKKSRAKKVAKSTTSSIVDSAENENVMATTSTVVAKSI